ncbi:Bug family tripartite tricarboxylate transporter substrate binding protein [Ramlibacter sp.]|uniref:Bug family tripartite tricarboxylate transporter substrate binding protein n=1 Tax=Ramlibacter sp. TaxID=1917967 RepID=UPI003D0D6828
MRFVKGVRACALVSALCMVLPHAGAADDKTVRLVVSSQAGGNNDTVARIVAPKFAEALGQPVIVDNKPGANGMIAAKFVATATIDGTALLIGTTSLAMVPATLKAPAVDARKDFVPVSNLVEVPVVLVAGKDFKGNSVKDMLAMAKSDPGKLTVGIFASSFIFYAERMALEPGTKFTRVHYKGMSDTMNDVVAGRVDMLLDTVGLQLPHIKAGRTKPLAVFTAKRHPLLPDTPTMDETGFKGFADNPFVGVFAPAGTPPETVQRLNAALQKSLAHPEVKGKLEGMGFSVISGNATEFAERYRADVNRYEDIARKANLPKE